MHWMVLPFQKYAQFDGRSRRMEYWMFALLNVLVTLVVVAVIVGTGGATSLLSYEESGAGISAGMSMLMGGAGLILALWWLVTLIPNIAVNVRRLHDRDMSGWWYLGFIVASVIPFVGYIAGIAYLVLMFLPGTPGPNRFGADPKGAGEAETFA